MSPRDFAERDENSEEKNTDGQYPVVDESTEVDEDELEPLEGLWSGLGEGAQHISRRSPCRSSTL